MSFVRAFQIDTCVEGLTAMNPTYYQEMFPSHLVEELQTTWPRNQFSRRTIFIRDEGTKTWVLLGCVLAPLPEGVRTPEEAFEFERAILKADSVPSSELGTFLSDVSSLSQLARIPVFTKFHPQCQVQRVPLSNYWMKTPGVVYTWGAQSQVNPPPGELLSSTGPYYPSVDDAAKDWLQLGGHAGLGDGYKGNIVLLLPETRAFIRNHSWSEDDEHLRLDVEGSALNLRTVLVKGAYWIHNKPTQLAQEVTCGSVTLEVPREAYRLELNLLSEDGTVYEQHRENMQFIGERRFLGSRHRMSSDRIAKALKEGEGARVEFKPFILLPKHKAPVKGDARDKLDEVLETVAAFSNADGGTIFLGVTNDVRVVGVGEGLARASGMPVTREALERYAGELRTHVRDEMYLPVDIDVSVQEHANEYLVLVEVPAVRDRFVSVKKDGRLVRRHGGSNKHVPPEEWTPRERDFFLS